MLVVNFAMDLDSPVVAWQARVVEELAARVTGILVLTERLGRVNDVDNVAIDAIPRHPIGVPQRVGGGVLYNPRALRLVRRFRPDVAFIHMAHQWTYRLAPTFAFARLPIVLWYAHGSVTRRLKLSHRLADRVITSSPEGFRLASRKVRVIGQGVDTELFSLRPRRGSKRAIVYVGRMSRRKRVDLMLNAVGELARLRPEAGLKVKLVGPTLTADDRSYVRELEVAAAQMTPTVEFVGAVPPAELPRAYDDAWVHLSLSETGSMDKTILESLACGIPVVTSNPAFRRLLERQYPEFLVTDDNLAVIAAHLAEVYEKRDVYDPHALRALVQGEHDLAGYVDRVHAQLVEVGARKPA